MRHSKHSFKVEVETVEYKLLLCSDGESKTAGEYITVCQILDNSCSSD